VEIVIKNKKRGNLICLVDECDFDLVHKTPWTYLNGYAYSCRNKILMHRLILGITDRWTLVDHINHNRLDNRRSNIRICGTSENQKNRLPRGASKYLGVSITKDSYVRAQIKNKGLGNVYLGTFKTEEDAARAYDAAAKIIHGEFANLNFK
jgi:hypothetical protein